MPLNGQRLVATASLLLRFWRAHAAAVDAALPAQLGGELIDPALAQSFWTGLRDQTDEFFAGAEKAVALGATLWRISVPQTAPPLKLSGEQLVEWGGGQRWLCTSTAPGLVRDAAATAGGHATLYRAIDKSSGVFTPLKAPLDRIHRQLKTAFDPDGLFNRGRLYPEF